MDVLLPPGILEHHTTASVLPWSVSCEWCGWGSGACFWRSTAIGHGWEHWRAVHEDQP